MKSNACCRTTAAPQTSSTCPRALSRINMKINRSETEVNGEGPRHSKRALSNACSNWTLHNRAIPRPRRQRAQERAGGSPTSASARGCRKGACALWSTPGPLLQNVLRYRPFLIKPNDVELGELFGVTIHSDEQIVDRARRLQRMGAQHVLVSAGGDGALLVTADGQTLRQRRRRAPWSIWWARAIPWWRAFWPGSRRAWIWSARFRSPSAGSATAFTHWLAGREEILCPVPGAYRMTIDVEGGIFYAYYRSFAP